MSNDAVIVPAFLRDEVARDAGLARALSQVVGTTTALGVLLAMPEVAAEEAVRLRIATSLHAPGDLVHHARRYVEDFAAKHDAEEVALLKRRVFESLRRPS